MPLITLEYTTNLKQASFDELFYQLHENVSSMVNVDVNKLKSKAIPLQQFAVGLSHQQQAFVILTLEIFEEQIHSIYDKMEQYLSESLENFFKPLTNDLSTQLCVHIKAIDKQHFYKVVL